MGNGAFNPIRLKKHGQVEVVQYIKSEQMPQMIAGAEMIISHAGAGSIIEGLSARKPLLVVINQTLMDNHQFEIAEEMAKRGHIQMSTTPELVAAVRRFRAQDLVECPPRERTLFTDAVDKLVFGAPSSNAGMLGFGT